MRKIIIIVLAFATICCVSANPKKKQRHRLLCAATSTGFIPTDIAGCVVWLDASDTSTISTDASYTYWSDKSGNGNSVSNLTTSALVSTASSFNSLNSFYNDGTDNMWGFSLGLANSSQTVFLAIKMDAESGYPGIFELGQTLTGLWVQRQGGAQETLYVFNNNSGQLSATGALPNAGGNRLIVINKELDTSLYTAVGTNSTVSTLSTRTAAYTDNPFQIGKRTDNTAGCKGYYGEFIVYNSSLNDENQALVKAYLTAKWNLEQ